MTVYRSLCVRLGCARFRWRSVYLPLFQFEIVNKRTTLKELGSTVAEAGFIPENILKRISQVSFGREVFPCPGVDDPDRRSSVLAFPARYDA